MSELYLLNKMKPSLLFFACIVTTGISLWPAFLPAQVIAAGGYHSLAVCNDGTVNTWGNNQYGQLGNGTNTNSNVPVTVSSLTGIIAVAGGRDHSLALRNNGTVWCWGLNSTGQLGNGTLINSNIPVQVTGLTGVIAIAARRGWYSLALKSNGTVWAWGQNFSGQLGNGTFTNSPVPVQVNSLNGIVAIDGGYFHCLALKNDGTVWSWGGNQFGQLGDGTTTGGPNWGKSTPVQVIAPAGITALAGGAGHSIALKNNGTVWMWGDNVFSQYGDGTCNEVHVPMQVNNFSSSIAIAGGADHSIVLKNNGTVWTAGRNSYGSLGNGTNFLSAVPVQVSSLTNVIDIDGGEFHSIALRSDNTVWDWGHNLYGELGNASFTNSNVPVQVINLCSAIPLPVELLDFSAEYDKKNSEVDLAWQTASEINNDYFTIEKSKNAIDFIAIGTMNGAGNSTQVTGYSFTDRNPFAEINYYRLRQTDYNGKNSLSKIVSVYASHKAAYPLLVYPVITTDFISVFTDGAPGDFEITIVDMMGRTIMKTLQKNINVSHLTGGLYSVMVSTAGARYSQKFIKQ